MIFLLPTDGADTHGDAMSAIELRLEPDGRILLPLEARERLGIRPGDALLIDASNEGALLWTRATAATALQKMVAAGAPRATSLVDELRRLRGTEGSGLETWPRAHSAGSSRGRA